jgi:two-component system cell cycle response regulator
MVIPPVTQQVEAKRPTSMTSRDACLVHIYPTGSAIGTRHLLEAVRIVLGRGDECDITIHDSSVSRRHTRFDLEDGVYVATDLDSTNGTFVNDKAARQTPLADGDYLRVGTCIFRYLAGGNVEADYHEELYRMATLDALTGLHNRRYLIDYLERELARSTRFGRPLALILFDIDHFKRINDQFGHLNGDLTLRVLAARLKSEICRGEMLARYGGEEFAAVLTETPHERAIEVAERFRRAAEDHAFDFEGTPYQVTVSLGVASIQFGESPSALELLQCADDRLYQAKNQGRNRVIA